MRNSCKQSVSVRPAAPVVFRQLSLLRDLKSAPQTRFEHEFRLPLQLKVLLLAGLGRAAA